MTGELGIQDRVTTVETDWIVMQDGRRLAARLFLPVAVESPVPAILEYIPYRRRDGTRARDDETHKWFAANGYACARVDIAGTGDSDGLVEDEYHLREQDDALEIIAWLATQPWCSGAVGMIGISWGGFNGLQVAARRPPALKAVVSLCSTVDRYADDVHFMGGCLLNDNLDWGGAFFTYAALPPDPRIVGDVWRDMWKDRADALELYPAKWLEHQRRDAFWRHGSVVEDYAAIETPVLAVSGWADGYTAAVFELVKDLSAPCKGIVGPWGHRYPHKGVPGPAIGFLQECLRWWDRWLKGHDTGVENDPALRLWLQDPMPPAAHYDERPGRWIGIDSDLSSATSISTLPLGAGEASICSPQTVGAAGGEWCAYALGKVAPEMPLDQRMDDAGSLTIDGAVLDAPIEIVGRPVAKLRFFSDKPQALVVARLCDVRPDGSVSRISFGMLNLAHLSGSDTPSPLVPGQWYNATVPLNEIAQAVEPGHRLRLSISTSYWPMVWPSCEAATLTFDLKQSSLELPLLLAERSDRPVSFEPSRHAPEMALTIETPGAEHRTLVRDIGASTTTFLVTRDDGWSRIDDIDTSVHYGKAKEFVVGDDDPLRCKASIRTIWARKRADWDVRVETQVTMTADERAFVLTGTYRGYANGQPFAERSLEKTIARDNL